MNEILKIVIKLKILFEIFREFWTKPRIKGIDLVDFRLSCALLLNYYTSRMFLKICV